MRLVNPVALIILDEKNERVLLAKRSKKLFGFENTWSIPGGGTEKGETFEEGLNREILEELECKIKDFKYFMSTYMEIDNIVARTIYFWGHVEGKVNLKSDELSEFEWFTLEMDILDKLEFAFKQKEVLKSFIDDVVKNSNFLPPSPPNSATNLAFQTDIIFPCQITKML